MKNGHSRRHLLQLTGLGAGSLFLPSLMAPGLARAASPPKRLVLYQTRHGPHYANWAMRRPGLPETSANWEIALDSTPESEWSRILKPLFRHRKKLLVLDGLAMTSGFSEPERTNNHNIGTSHGFTGARMTFKHKNSGTGGGSSIDQYFADAFAQPGRIHSLHFTTQPGSWTPFFKGDAPLSGERDPSKVYQRLASGVQSDSSGAPSKGDLLAQGRADVLGAVKTEYDAVLSRLSTEDKKKLGDHADMISSLQKMMAAPKVTGCTLPDGNFSSDPNSRIERFNRFVPLTTVALACDITRAIGIQKEQMNPSEFGVSGVGDTHQDLAHGAHRDANNARTEGMTKYYIKEAEHFAQLLDGLDSVSEGNGTLLDNTCVLWGCELANGPHELYRMMYIVAGSAGGKLKTGRYLKYAEDQAQLKPDWYGAGSGRHGPPHSKLLISILQALGVNRNELPVKDARAADGSTVNMTGPLPRLLA